jgi:dihydroorotate dehydrogenase (fumarate)
LYNASGPRSGTIEALHKIALSKSGAVLTKSATLVLQEGNPLPRTYHTNDEMTSFNSEGLPNRGIDYYISPETKREVMEGNITSTTTTTTSTGAKKKPYIVSLSGKCLEDNLEMIRRIMAVNYNNHHHHDHQDNNVSSSSSSSSPPSVQPPPPNIVVDSIELNVACPNIIGKPIIGYDMEQMKRTLQQVEQVLHECQTQYPQSPPSFPSLGIKLPPYLDMVHIQTVTQLLNQYHHIISYVVAINTVGNTLCIDGKYMETPYIASNQGFAGMSGPAIRYIALANVRKLRELLIPTIKIVGVGGIRTGQDVYDMILCGANACQVATQHWKEGSEKCFDRIYQELIQIMQQKGYTNLQQQVYNQLQPYSKERANIARQLQQEDKRNVAVTNSLSSSMSSPNSKTSHEDEVFFYKSLSIILIVVLAIVFSYELQQRLPVASLLPSE